MGYFERGLAFAAIGFAVANAALSLLAVLIWRAARPRLRGSGSLFLLRMAPSLGSAIVVAGLVLPGFRLFEPRTAAETAGPAPVVLVLLAGALIAAGVFRTLVSLRDTRRLERAWRVAGVRSPGLGIPVPAYRVHSDLPLAALVGVLRPRLFVSGAFLEALSAGERRAVVAHETAHLASFDNLKRLAMRLAPDWLSLSPAAAEIEWAWVEAAEDEADDRASGPDRGRCLDLAGALLKASRMMPGRCAPVSNFADEATIARRVARLLDDPPARPGRARHAVSAWVWASIVLGAAALLAAPALPVVYAAIEAAVHLLN